MFLFEEMVESIGFEPEDSLRLRELHGVLCGEFDRVARVAFELLMESVRTRRYSDEHDQTDRLLETLRSWLDELLRGPHDEGYFERRRQLGRLHLAMGFRPNAIFAVLNLVRRELLGGLLGEDQPWCRPAHIGSLEKIIDIDLTIVLQTYWEEQMRNKLQVPAALAAGLAHEIRNPLNAIGLHLTLLERRLRRLGDDSEAAATSIEGIRSEVRRMRALTSEIVDFAKPLDLAFVWVDPRELSEAIEVAHAASLGASGIELELIVHGEGRLWCDRDQIHHALVALLMNAVEAMDGAGRIRIELTADGLYSVIKVQDDGAGIPRELQSQVFDLFFTTKASGTGLGLPAVQKIVEAHQGTIELDSQANVGTTVWIKLPRPRS